MFVHLFNSFTVLIYLAVTPVYNINISNDDDMKSVKSSIRYIFRYHSQYPLKCLIWCLSATSHHSTRSQTTSVVKGTETNDDDDMKSIKSTARGVPWWLFCLSPVWSCRKAWIWWVVPVPTLVPLSGLKSRKVMTMMAHMFSLLFFCSSFYVIYSIKISSSDDAMSIKSKHSIHSNCPYCKFVIMTRFSITSWIIS